MAGQAGRLALLALLQGCLGPLLPLPNSPHLAHDWLCVRRACPAQAALSGGVVMGARYDRARRLCECLVEDWRHLPALEYPDPHDH